MAETFLLEIVTPARKLLSKEVEVLTAPAFNGEIGVLAGHTQLLTILRAGEITYKMGSESDAIAVGRGYAEVLPDKTTILVDVADTRAEIDLDKAKKAYAESEEALKGLSPDDEGYAEALDAFELAGARILVKEKQR